MGGGGGGGGGRGNAGVLSEDTEGGGLTGCPRGEATSLGAPIGGEAGGQKEPDVSVWDSLAGVADNVGDGITEDDFVILEDS